MTNDWTRHVESLKSRLSELNETIETIKTSVESRPGLDAATRAIASLLQGGETGLSSFPSVLSEILKDPLMGAIIVGPQGEFLLFNLTAQDMLGKPYLSGAGRVDYRFMDVSQTVSLNPGDLPWAKALSGEALPDVRLFLAGNDGTDSRWLSVSATPFTGPQRQVSGAVVFMIDSTEEVNLESSIESICDTISSQIAQVGSTQDQLQDLAEKLSKTGVQRLLTEGRAGLQQGPGGEPSHPKKSPASQPVTEPPVFGEPKAPIIPPAPGTVEPPLPVSQSAGSIEAPPLGDSSFASVESNAFETAAEAEQDEPQASSEAEELSIDYQDLESRYEKTEEESSSPETLFDKLANYTQETEEEIEEEEEEEEEETAREHDFYSAEEAAAATEQETEKEEELESGLPWPNLVDAGEDYPQPLWEEYTQTDETSASESFQNRVEAEPAVEEPENGSMLAEESGEFASVELEEEEEESEMSFDDLDVPEVSQVSEEEEEEEEDEEADESLMEMRQAAEVIEDESINEFEDQVPAYLGATAEDEAGFKQELKQELKQEKEDSEPEPIAEVAPEPEPEPEIASEPEPEEEARPSLRDTLFKKKARQPRSSYTRLKSLGSSELESSLLDDSGIESVESQVVSYRPVEEEPGEPSQKKVLVVDDIPVNQKLLLLHLRRLGYEADIANNGQEALDALASNDYELILMDCDMPVMNGFEAAARIRNNEAFSHSRIPIIALTSYDREGDREKCIAAGMDDYITKGASRKELKETIERSIVSAREKSQGMGGDDLEEDLPPLDLDSLLKLYGKEEVEEISKLFLSNMGTYIECMQLAIDEKDAESVVHFSNAVKGPCAALGIKLMTRLTTDIITFAEEGDWTQVRVKYMRLKAVFVQTREKLKKICPDDSLMAT
ncbi:MAG: response regulator [Candidatus Obscuribacterales bacterium]